jgi:hypothetical protein
MGSPGEIKAVIIPPEFQRFSCGVKDGGKSIEDFIALPGFCSNKDCNFFPDG